MKQTRISQQTIQSYEFLVEKEKASQSFTLPDLESATGWKKSTITTYITKKWASFLTRNGDDYIVNGVMQYSLEAYSRLMSQNQSLSTEPLKPLLEDHVERLVVKARDAAMNALDAYNRPNTAFKTEGFIVMMIIAWRYLFHAYFEKIQQDYRHYDKQQNLVIIDGEEKHWELSQCIKQYYQDREDPVKSNLECMIGLRNKIEHRYVPAFDAHITGECQAMLLNFDEFLVTEFSDFYAIRESLTVPLQTSNTRSESQITAMKKFQGKHYDELMEYIDTFRDGLPDHIYQDLRYSFRVYLIPKLGNHITSSDTSFEFIRYDQTKPDDIEALRKLVVLIKDRQVPVANLGAYKPSGVARKVASLIGREFKVHHHTLAWKMYSARKAGCAPDGCNTKFCQFDQVHNDYIYTQEWVDFLVGKLSNSAEYEKLLAFKGE